MTDAPGTPLPPAGWYPDPARPDVRDSDPRSPGRSLRWWSGQGWTAYTAVAGPPPRPPRAPSKWIGRWGGWWIAAACLVVCVIEFAVGLALGGVQKPAPPEYDVLDPVLLVIGSGCVAAAFLYVMSYRLDPRWGLSVGRLVGGGLLAGFLAAFVAGLVNTFVNAFAGGTAERPSLTTFALVGVVEESAKLVATMLLARGLPVKNARVGLFLGGAVGFGFSVIENVGYLETAWSVGLAHHEPIASLLATAISRQLLGPLLHPVLTGLLAAAVFGAGRNGRFRLTPGVIGAFLAVAAAHSGFDLGSGAAGRTADPRLGGAIALLTVVLYVAASATAWILVSRALRRRHPPESRMPAT